MILIIFGSILLISFSFASTSFCKGLMRFGNRDDITAINQYNRRIVQSSERVPKMMDPHLPSVLSTTAKEFIAV